MYSITDNLYINIKYRLSMQYTNRLYMNIAYRLTVSNAYRLTVSNAYRLTVSNADKLSADMCIDCRQICRQSIRNTVDCQYHYAGTVNM